MSLAVAFQGDKCILSALNLEREVEAGVAWTGEKFRRSWSWQLPCPPHRPCSACCWLPGGGAQAGRSSPRAGQSRRGQPWQRGHKGNPGVGIFPHA